jgi:hypothetical protein
MVPENLKDTLYVAIGYSIGILVLWNIPYLQKLLWPFKILTVALHEFGHASAGYMTGAKIEAITLDPEEGGLTKMRGGNPYITLPAGYIGSTFWGSLMVFAGFNATASKITAVIVMLCMALTIFWARNWLAIVINTGFMAVIIALWVFNDRFLSYFILFLGVMSALYSLWDIVDDLIKRRVNESDASQFSRLCCKGAISPRFWYLGFTKGVDLVLVFLVLFGRIDFGRFLGIWMNTKIISCLFLYKSLQSLHFVSILKYVTNLFVAVSNQDLKLSKFKSASFISPV